MLLIEKLKKEFPKVTFPSYEYERKIIKQKGCGDLSKILGLASYGYDTDVIFSYKNSKLENFYTSKETVTPINDSKLVDSIISTPNSTGLKAVIFRDSFFEALRPFIYPMFSKTYARWRTNSMMEEEDKELILKEKPDIIIHEMIERRLMNFCEDKYFFYE